jgi:hypothetical protein
VFFEAIKPSGNHVDFYVSVPFVFDQPVELFFGAAFSKFDLRAAERNMKKFLSYGRLYSGRSGVLSDTFGFRAVRL